MNPLAKPPSSYPDCFFVARSVRIGGFDKGELLARLYQEGVELNAAGLVLFGHSGFTTSMTSSIMGGSPRLCSLASRPHTPRRRM